MTKDEQYMHQALELARKGAGFVSPNPMVGCVIVKGGKVVAKGYHKKYGGHHAEIEALKTVIARSEATKQSHKQRLAETSRARLPHDPNELGSLAMTEVKGATIYVTLEPCAHYGKTPPCVDALIPAKPNRVVLGLIDPNSKTAGQSIRKLRRAGIQVEVGVLEEECVALSEVFGKYITTGKPFVLLKSAITLDGKLTKKKGTRSDFSCPESYGRVHELRQQYDAIALGVNSVLIDKPKLTSRGKGRRSHPTRVIFDTRFRIPENAAMFGEPGETIVFVGPTFSKAKKKRIETEYRRAQIVSVPKDRDGHVSFKKILAWLGKHSVSSVMVEGGGQVATAMLNQKLIDKIMITHTPHVSGDPHAPRLLQTDLKPFSLRTVTWERIGVDAWLTGYPEYS